MPNGSRIPQINTQRPECVRLANRIKELQALQKDYRYELQHTTDLEEREQILDILQGLEEHIDALREELAFQGCYVFPTNRGMFLKVTHIETTQSTQFLSLEGTGAGPDNGIRLVVGKPMLVRVYVRSLFAELISVTGRLSIYDFNNNTWKYDVFRKNISPIQFVTMAASSASRRRNLGETLNFIVSEADCRDKCGLKILVWVAGHEGDPIYEGEGVLSPVEFVPRQVPIIHCFRIRFTQNIPGMPAPPPNVLAAPSDADCRATMDLAQRMFPLADLDIRDRGTLNMSGFLETQADYQVVRQQIQNLRDGTTPTPQNHEIYVGMLPAHGNASNLTWGMADAGAIESIVGAGPLFAHELGHLLLPGDDHVSDAACPNNALVTQIDTNYPNYANTTVAAGIGEFGVDLAASPPTLFGPDSPDIMSYCVNRWISPYNYQRAMTGNVLTPAVAPAGIATRAQKLLVSLRAYRDGRVELRHGMHLPGEPRSLPGKAATGIHIELYGTNDELFASAECCHRASERLQTAPYEDLQEVLPWNEQISHVVVVREGKEVARWEIEEAAADSPVTELTCHESHNEEDRIYFRVNWKKRARAKPRHYMLRFTPDGGETWLPVAVGSDETQVDVDASCLQGRKTGRFQLAVSTGFRTYFVESEEVSLPGLTRQVAIIHPAPGAEIDSGDPVSLVGATTRTLGDNGNSIAASWTSNRDGFIGDGHRVLANGLSAGRHVLTLTVADEVGGEATKSVSVWVRRRGTTASGETG